MSFDFAQDASKDAELVEALSRLSFAGFNRLHNFRTESAEAEGVSAWAKADEGYI